ncbi:MAG: heme-binding domain-containing protein, partial [Verrucomicrobiota bacterium]
IEARDGGWYGYGGPKADHNPTFGRDWPLCWIPHAVDNSSGSQAWIPAGQWGDLGDQMVHLLWGRCGMMLALRDDRGTVPQGAVVPLPVKFLSGPNRATFHAREGALYVAGSTGWQTSAVKDGALQRVRRTSRPLRVPVAWRQDGTSLEFTFAEKLDPALAADPGSFGVRRWNYRYSQDYGSKDWSLAHPGQEGRDEVGVSSAVLLPDGRTVRITLADARPAMQYELRYDVGARGQLWFSLHGH